MTAHAPLTCADVAPGELHARYRPLTDVDALQDRWRALERRSRRSFFLSWTWIEAWIDTLAAHDLGRPVVLDVSGDDAPVGLGLFVERRDRPRLLPFNRGLLHATGAEAADLICIEANTLLTARGFDGAAWRVALAACADARGWEEVAVDKVRSTDADAIAGAAREIGWNIERADVEPSAYVDLDALRAAGAASLDAYVETLGRSTRQQLRRSIRKYQAIGPLGLDVAEDAAAALDWFEAAGAAHRARWPQGGYSSPFFLDFHRRLIRSGFASGAIQMMRARAGEHVFGWLYAFADRGDVLFYQGAFEAPADPHMKPGLTAHALAVADRLGTDAARYDFLAGGDRYKFNLGQTGPTFERVVLQRPGLKTHAESAIRTAKRAAVRSFADFRRRSAG